MKDNVRYLSAVDPILDYAYLFDSCKIATMCLKYVLCVDKCDIKKYIIDQIAEMNRKIVPVFKIQHFKIRYDTSQKENKYEVHVNETTGQVQQNFQGSF